MGASRLPWNIFIFFLFYSLCAAHHRYKGLYPSAFRVKRGTASLVNPIFLNSVKDANLLYEILLDGLQFEDEHGQFSVHDQELASLRKVRKLEVICEDIIPKTVPEVHRLIFALAQDNGVLRKEDFERTVLTLVYTAQKTAQVSTAHQKDAWAECFISLYKIIKDDLTIR
ncbi:protein FAM180A-like [Neoarius graeffei]|uniref:protein FAM180A-like n=1 Tax=Neoarius graeffei TaxID=443677 RepID=UPI00298D07D6|nr:protein FAM180A-like [Neoarius graeffei]